MRKNEVVTSTARFPRLVEGIAPAMPRQRGSNALRLIAAAFAMFFTACNSTPPQTAPPPAQVKVAHPVVRNVVEWDEFTARLEAVDAVEVRARVSGYLESVHFAEGGFVRKGDVLFAIDPRPYTAILNRAEADVVLAKARVELADKRYERATKLVARNAISQEETDTRAAEARQTQAALQAARAAAEAARLDVEFTQVHAPISGRISRKLVTEGNLVNGGSGTQATLLTTIVSLDPIYVYFEADEQSFLKYTRLAREGLRPSSRDTHNPVEVGFADEQGFPHHGHMDFVDNRLDPNTGTMTGRAVLSNPDLSLAPGLFARLRLVGSAEYRAVLIPDAAINTDQAQKFVYVVEADDTAQYRTITIGPLNDGLRIVRSGLTADDRVVVSGVQRLRPGAMVIAEEEAIAPAAGAPPAEGSATAPANAPPVAWKANQ